MRRAWGGPKVPVTGEHGGLYVCVCERCVYVVCVCVMCVCAVFICVCVYGVHMWCVCDMCEVYIVYVYGTCVW